LLLTRRSAALGLAAQPLAAGAPRPGAPARRVVSIGLCLDVILTAVAERSQIVALSHYSLDPTASVIADLARTFPITHETADEVVALRPDLVLASRRSNLPTRLALKRLGYRVEEFDVPNTVEGSLAQVRRLGRLVGQEARSEAVVATIEQALRAAAPKPGEPAAPAMVYQYGGLTAGRQTLVGDMMQRCGLENVAARYGLRKWGQAPLERLIAEPPRVLLVGEVANAAPGWGERVMTHPALASLEPRMHRVAFPPRLLYCGGPVLIQVAEVMAKARREAAALQRS
jgi:iron complex transport system substrate-binding protein